MTCGFDEDDDRRAFLRTCGRFAAVTPPVMTLLLSTSLTSKAIARSGGLNDAAQSDRSPSFFDNDRSPARGSGTSGGGGGGAGVGSGFSRGGTAGAPAAGGTSGGGSGSSGTRGVSGRGPFATGGGSGVLTADGGVDCADEEWRRKADCDVATGQLPNITASKQ